MGLERRVSNHAEAAGTHAEGQCGFRPHRNTEQAALALRTLVEQHRLQPLPGSSHGRPSRQRGTELWACFVDFKQAYDRVPRQQLWRKLESLGYNGAWLKAVQALYADVPMSVSVPGLQGRTFQATQGLKQGCPLSPMLFTLYIDDFEEVMLAAASGGAGFDLPELVEGQPAPPVLYADDMALLATSASGLQAQLRELEAYCRDNSLTVNIKKTKVMLLSGAASEDVAMRKVQAARLTYAGTIVPAVAEFKYLGVDFHCCRTLGESAAAGRAGVARFAAARVDARCSELGLEAAHVLLMLFDVMVDSTLSYASAVWAPELAATAAARPVVGAGNLSEPELQHLRFLRQLLGLPQCTPTATLLAEAGQPPLYVRWLQQSARMWNSLVAAPAGSLMQQTLSASLALAEQCSASPGIPPARQPWLMQLARGLRAAGTAFDPMQQEQLDIDSVWHAAMTVHLQRVEAALPTHTRMRQYFWAVRPECLQPEWYGLPDYITDVRERRCRRGLTELITGLHWGADETGRRTVPITPRAQRLCRNCTSGNIEDTHHIVFDCPLYGPERTRWPELFAGRAPSLHAFFKQSSLPLARFAAACRRRGRQANGLPP
jgi:hypothetical protein